MTCCIRINTYKHKDACFFFFLKSCFRYIKLPSGARALTNLTKSAPGADVLPKYRVFLKVDGPLLLMNVANKWYKSIGEDFEASPTEQFTLNKTSKPYNVRFLHCISGILYQKCVIFIFMV